MKRKITEKARLRRQKKKRKKDRKYTPETYLTDEELRSEPPYKTIKTSLASVAKHQSTIDKLFQVSSMVHQITCESLYFIKLYLIYNNNYETVVVDKNFLSCVFATICSPSASSHTTRNTELRQHLESFYYTHFTPLLPENHVRPSSYQLHTTLLYKAVAIATIFNNNIISNYVQYAERFVNISFNKVETLNSIKHDESLSSAEKQSSKRVFTTLLRKIKNDLLEVDSEAPMTSPIEYHTWINDNKMVALPEKLTFENNSVLYDIHVNPSDYFASMFRMSRFMEERGQKLLNCCPLTTSVIPGHFTLDTKALVYLLYNKSFGIGTYSEVLRSKIKSHKTLLWSMFFKTKMKGFQMKNYVFNEQVDTDGVSVSINLIRRDLYGRKGIKEKVTYVPEIYGDELNELQKSIMSKKKIVGIDPGMSDLLFCANESGNQKFRYTQDQRRKELKIKKYRYILMGKKMDFIFEERTIIDWESELSAFNSKSLDFRLFKSYVQKKLEITSKTKAFYEDFLHRKMKLNAFYNTRKSEQLMVNQFKARFGPPGTVVIGFGDWEQKQHRRFKEPTKGKGFRKLMRQSGYDVLLVDEFRTSLQCSKCQIEDGKCLKFRKRLDPNKKKSDEDRQFRLVHGLLKCNTCNRIWNRDFNAAINIALLTRCILDRKDRPGYLRRQNSSS